MIDRAKEKIYNLLRSSEKWTKTDMVYLVKGGFWLSSGKVVGSLGSFLLAIVYANLLSKEDYAIYKYILSLSVIVSIPTLMSLTESLTRSIALGYEGSLIKTLITKLKWGLLGTLTGLLISAYYFYQSNQTIALGFLYIAILSPLIDSFMLYSSFLQGKKKFKEISIYNNIKTIVTTISIILLVYLTSNISLIILGNYLMTFIATLVIFIVVIKSNKFNDKIDTNTISYGKHLSLMNALNTVVGQIDKVLTWHFLGPVNLAIYSFATIPSNQIQSFFKSIPILAFPKITQQDNNTIKKTLPLKIFRFSLVILLFVILYILTAPFLFKLFFPEYTDAVLYSQLFSLTLLFYPVRMVSHTLIAKQQKRSLYIIQFISPISKLVLYFTLLPLFGLYGLVFASIASLILDSVYQFYFFYKI